MALLTATITFNVSDMLGVDFDIRRTKAWTSTNVENDTLIDTAANQIRMGDGKATIGTDGTGSFTVWIPGAGANPASWQTYFNFDYVMPGSRQRTTRVFGPFTLTGNADLADLEAEQAIPPSYQSGFIAQAQAYLDQQESLAGIDSSDSATAYNTQYGPLTKAALSNSFVVFRDQAGNPLPAGSVTTIKINTTTGDIDDIVFTAGS